jgi:hypothetical protein
VDAFRAGALPNSHRRSEARRQPGEYVARFVDEVKSSDE